MKTSADVPLTREAEVVHSIGDPFNWEVQFERTEHGFKVTFVILSLAATESCLISNTA